MNTALQRSSSLCAALLAATLCPGQHDAQALLDRHAAWLGGRDALSKLTALHARGDVRMGQMSGPIDARMRRSGELRHQLDLGAIASLVVISGERAHRVNASGQVEPLPAHQVAKAQHELARAFYAYLDEPTTYLGDETKDGVTLAVLRWQRPARPAVELLIDPRDGRLAWERSESDGKVTWSEPSDWREVGGVRMPFVVTTSVADQTVSTITWRELFANPEFAAETFAKPEQRTSLAEFAADKDSTGWLPIDLYLDRYVYLRGTLQGEPTDIVLDSGAGATVIDDAFARRLGIASTGEIEAKGVGGKQGARTLRGVDLQLGALTLRGLRGVAIDLSGVGTMLGRAMPVILGKEVFHELIVDIDYPNRRIAFHRRDSFTYRGEGRAARLLAGQDGHRAIEATIEDGPVGRFTVDTGSGGTLDLFAHFTQAHRLLDGRKPTSQTQSGGVGGKILTTTGTLRALSLAGYRLRDVPVGFAAPKVGVFASTDVDGNLGAGVFRRFRMVFDYSRDTVHLEPGADWDTAPFRRDRLGVSFERDGDALRVCFVAPGSPAAQAGVQVGEKFSALGDEPLDLERWRQQLARFADVAPGTERVLRRTDGSELRLVAHEFY